MSLLPSSPKDRKLLALALLPVFIAFAYWHFIDSPVREEIADLNDRLETLERKNAVARNAGTAPAMLQRLQQAVIEDGNVFEVLMDAVRVCSLGQITNALFEVGGQYRRNM